MEVDLVHMEGVTLVQICVSLKTVNNYFQIDPDLSR